MTVLPERYEEEGRTIAVDRIVVPGQSYDYRLVVRTDGNEELTFGPVHATAADRLAFAIETIAPNPSREGARIEFTVAHEAHVALQVFDLHGREVALLSEGTRRPGHHHVVWDGRGPHGPIEAGIYFVRYRAPGTEQVRRLVWLR